jgi:hypothetical protein
MKKALIILSLSFLFVSAAALADAVSVTSQTAFSSPAGPTIQSADWVGFQGPWTITFTVAGKTCNLNGSARGSVPTGCNYALTVAPDGSISGVLTAGNSVCTQSADIAASCQ